jgi:hypothetical protein
MPDRRPVTSPLPTGDHGRRILSHHRHITREAKKMSTPTMVAAIAAVFLSTVLSPCRAAFASGSDGIGPAATDEPVALYISLCLWSRHHPSPMCREIPLTPGAAWPVFASMKACQDGQEEALRKWQAEAGPVFGFTATAGDGYRIDGMWCSPVVRNSRRSDIDD